MSKALEYVYEQKEYIGPEDEGADFYYALQSAVSIGHGIWEEQAEQVAEIAYQLQLDAVLWIYIYKYFKPEEWGLPSVEEFHAEMEPKLEAAIAKFIQENPDKPDQIEALEALRGHPDDLLVPAYGSSLANELAEWAIANISQARRDLYWIEYDKKFKEDSERYARERLEKENQSAT